MSVIFLWTKHGRVCLRQIVFMRIVSDALMCFCFSNLSTSLWFQIESSNRTLVLDLKYTKYTFQKMPYNHVLPSKSEFNYQPIFVLIKNVKEWFTPMERHYEDHSFQGGVHKLAHDALWMQKGRHSVSSHFVIIREQQVLEGKI